MPDRICWDCRGSKRVWYDHSTGDDGSYEPCQTCNGMGVLKGRQL